MQSVYKEIRTRFYLIVVQIVVEDICAHAKIKTDSKAEQNIEK